MNNMLSYIEQYGNADFTTLEFCEVDSLILAQAAYFVMDGYVSSKHRFHTTLRDISRIGDANITQNTTLPKENAQLLEAIGQSTRFGNLPLGCYQSITDPESELQFAAVTFRLAPRLHYVAFRGTDTSLVGWKEDFNMSFSENIPAQLVAASYLKHTARFLRGHILVGGHSKGGNLAVYAAMHAPHGIKKRISAVYSHDGPGFLEKVYKSESFKSIEKRICKTVPHCAIVGLLFGTHGPYTVVASKSFPLIQHNPFTWEIHDRDFVRLKKEDTISRLTNRTFSTWLLEMQPEERKAFFDALFDILSIGGATTYPALIELLKSDLTPLRDKLKSLEPHTRTMIHKTLRALAKTGAAQLRLLIQNGDKF